MPQGIPVNLVNAGGLAAPKTSVNLPDFPAPLPEDVKKRFPSLESWEKQNKEAWQKIKRQLGGSGSGVA